MQTETNLITDTETELLKCLRGNDQCHFSKLYDTYSAALFGLIVNWISSDGDAEKTLQEVFITAWTNRSNYDVSKGRIFAWLYNIARQTCAEHLRCRASDENTKLILLEKNTDSFLSDTAGLRKLVYTL